MLELIIRGGWALWIITACSVISLGVALERWRTFRKANIDAEGLLDRVGRALAGGDVRSAIGLCEAEQGPVAETLRVGLRKLIFLEGIGKRAEEIEDGIVKAMEDHSAHVVEFLERNLTTLATVASLAPILGMMGTVFGMIRAFGSIHRMGNLTPEVVAGGISEALLCTAGGLVVAAMSTVEYNYFVARVNRFVLRVQVAGTALVERILDLRSNHAAETAHQER
jgi:biopolymer transport protein ExbB